MKKKLVKLANQIYDLEIKLQNGENITENMAKMQDLTAKLTPNEICEISAYLEEKLPNQRILNDI